MLVQYSGKMKKFVPNDHKNHTNLQIIVQTNLFTIFHNEVQLRQMQKF